MMVNSKGGGELPSVHDILFPSSPEEVARVAAEMQHKKASRRADPLAKEKAAVEKYSKEEKNG